VLKAELVDIPLKQQQQQRQIKELTSLNLANNRKKEINGRDIPPSSIE